jgi:hypothetical protein
MPRRKSLIAQMHEAHQKAKLQRQKEDERLRRKCGRTGARCGPAREGRLLNSAGKKNAQLGQASRGAVMGTARPFLVC